MNNVWCVRAGSGKYADQFVNGGYVAIGFGMMEDDLSAITSREEIYPLYRRANPQDTSDIVVGQQVGQAARFLLDMKGWGLHHHPHCEL
jgi:restriction system protein